MSTAIDKFMYIAVNRKFDNALRVSYSKTEEVDGVDQVEHKLVRESLRLLGISGGLEITSVADIPSRGTGLGSSSAFTVGLLHALYGHRHMSISSEDLAAKSCRIEIDLCAEPIGKQDQYAVAYGGLNFIRFDPDDTVTVQPIICAKATLQKLEQSLLVFYTGITRASGSITGSQSETLALDGAKQKIVQRMATLAHLLRDQLESNRLDGFGEVLHENWMLKKELTRAISNGRVDQWYEKARTAGAAGGKLLGAGTGGFLLFCAPPERHPAIEAALDDLRRIDFRMEPRGSRIILHQP
ncbi:MAG: hypothetical protein P4L56_20630 [Candidatus Sulfopaludibacter sp.]|nr:hypothetical protein [Candidatus Sulfopaludibacter sp.]